MSLRISIELPLETAAAIQHGEYDIEKLSGLVVNAVNDLPMRLPAPDKTEDREMLDDSEDSDSIITPAPSSENETFTLVESSGSGTTTPKTEDEAFYIDVERFNETGVPCDHYFPLVKKSMTVAELHQKIELHCRPFNLLEVEAQRFLLNGKRMRHGDTLGSYGIEAGSHIRLLHLTGVCFPDAGLDFFARKGWQPRHPVLPVHVCSSTSFVDLGLSLARQCKMYIPDQTSVWINGVAIHHDRLVVPHDTVAALGIADGDVVELHIDGIV